MWDKGCVSEDDLFIHCVFRKLKKMCLLLFFGNSNKKRLRTVRILHIIITIFERIMRRQNEKEAGFYSGPGG